MKKIALLVSVALLVISSACANKKNAEFEINNNQNKEVTEQQGQTDVEDSIKKHSQNISPDYVVKSINSKISGADILPAITQDYEGKVVLLDFWATWCGPCRAAMKKLDTIKADLQKKGAVFVYVTGETSPMKDWEPMIKGIKGDHYRLTNAQWGDLCSQLGIPGIPAYMLLNKDGSVAYSNLSTGGYPGNDILQNNIEVALTK